MQGQQTQSAHVRLTFIDGSSLDGNHITRDGFMTIAGDELEVYDLMVKEWIDEQTTAIDNIRTNERMFRLLVGSELHIINPRNIKWGVVKFY